VVVGLLCVPLMPPMKLLDNNNEGKNEGVVFRNFASSYILSMIESKYNKSKSALCKKSQCVGEITFLVVKQTYVDPVC